MRISPIYTPQNIINNPPNITNHPLFEHFQMRSQEFKANEHDFFHKVLKNEKKKENALTWFFAGSLAITLMCLYLAYRKLKTGLGKLKSK